MTRLRRLLVPTLVCVALFGGFAGYRLSWWRESPREAWKAISAAAGAGDYGAVWDRFDPTSRDRMSPDLRRFASDAVPDRHTGMTDRERFVLLLETRADVRGQFLLGRVVEVRESGDRASVRLDRPDPADRSPLPTPASVVYLVRHDGRWCLSFRGEPPR
jgi:hypothetical protein